MNSPNNKEYKATLTIPYPPVCAESCCKDYAWAMLSNIGSEIPKCLRSACIFITV